MNQNKGIVGLGLVVLIVLGIAVVGGGAYLLSKSSTNTQNNTTDINTDKSVITDKDKAQIEKTIDDLIASINVLDINGYLNMINSQDRSQYAEHTDKGSLRDLKKDYFDTSGNKYLIKIINIKVPLNQQLSPLSAGRVSEAEFIVNGVTKQFNFVKENEEWKYIMGFDKYNFNKTGESNRSANLTIENPAVCKNNDYTMAFVLVAKNQSEITKAKIDKINKIKDFFATDFLTATNGLAHMDTTYKVVTILDNGTLIKDSDSYLYTEEVVKKFYENNPDNFDFITIYPSFDDFNTINGQETHIIVKNIIKGIDTNGRGGILNNVGKYGSKGRLLGVNQMPNIDNVEFPEKDLWRSGGLLHETGHQWCCGVGDNFAKGEDGAELEIIQQNMHFYPGLSSPDKTGDPMNSGNWAAKGNGIYYRSNQPGIMKYHPFQLYFMGLLSKSEYSKKYTIYNAGVVGKDFNDQEAKFYKEVSVNDIIKIAGERQCVSF